MKKILALFFIISFYLTLSSCSKNEVEENYQEIILSTDTNLNEQNFIDIANGIAPVLVRLLEDKATYSLKVNRYISNRNNSSKKILIKDEVKLLSKSMEIPVDDVILFYKTLIKYKKVINSKEFSTKFASKLKDIETKNINNLESRWFLATLASALGASECFAGTLAVLDTCAYVATGILTAPTGVGAVANWGGAVASYGYALSTISKC